MTLSRSNASEAAAANAPRWPLLVTGALLVLVAWETTATYFQHDHRVDHRDWQAAVDLLRQQRKANEPVLIAPEWAEPVARQHLAGELSLELATLSDVDRFPKVWQLSIRGSTHRWLQRRDASRAWQPSQVAVSLFEQTPAQVLFDFREQLPHASVALIGARRATCPRRNARFVCGREDWNWVGVKIAEVDHRPYRCIYAHPLAEARLRLTFPDVPLGDQIVGYSGIDDFQSRREDRAAVFLQVFVGDKLLRTIKQANKAPWQRFAIDTRGLDDTPQQVRFELTTENAAQRTFCFHAEARR